MNLYNLSIGGSPLTDKLCNLFVLCGLVLTRLTDKRNITPMLNLLLHLVSSIVKVFATSG